MQEELLNQWKEEANRPFAGWDFSYILDTGRVQTDSLPWSYASIILPYIRDARSLLDMGTGGGELLSLLQPFPEHTCAAEGYEPNVMVAKQRLEPLGVKVVSFTDESNLPFREDEFEVIINRHESYDPNEVRRILTPSGSFITQQVGEGNDVGITQWLGVEPPKEKEWNVEAAAKELEASGFQVVKKMAAFPMTRFYDVGAMVYYLTAIPWTVADFSVEKYSEALLRLHERLMEEHYVEFREHRFLIIAKNPIS
jgi:hypothetical protein